MFFSLRGPIAARVHKSGREGATSCSDEGGSVRLVDGPDSSVGGAFDAVNLRELDILLREL